MNDTPLPPTAYTRTVFTLFTQFIEGHEMYRVTLPDVHRIEYYHNLQRAGLPRACVQLTPQGRIDWLSCEIKYKDKLPRVIPKDIRLRCEKIELIMYGFGDTMICPCCFRFTSRMQGTCALCVKQREHIRADDLRGIVAVWSLRQLHAWLPSDIISLIISILYDTCLVR